MSDAGLQCEIVWNKTNVGFAAACNQGADRGSAPYILFLNPDVELGAGSLSQPLAALDADVGHRIGAMGIGLTDAAGRRQRSCSRFPSPGRCLAQAIGLDRLLPLWVKPQALEDAEMQVSRDVDQIMGAFWLMRREDLTRLGGWDTRFFLYMEDVDLALRIGAAGQTSYYLATATAFHAGGGTTNQIRDIRQFYLWRSRILYARKHFSQSGVLVTTASCLLIEPISRLAFAALTGRWQDLTAGARAMRLLWRAYPFTSPADQGGVKAPASTI